MSESYVMLDVKNAVGTITFYTPNHNALPTEILKKLEKSHSSEELTDKVKSMQDEMQLSFFNLDDPLLENIKEEILETDIDTLTPVEALMKLNEIKRMLLKKK